jgi:hypothetical protein
MPVLENLNSERMFCKCRLPVVHSRLSALKLCTCSCKLPSVNGKSHVTEPLCSTSSSNRASFSNSTYRLVQLYCTILLCNSTRSTVAECIVLLRRASRRYRIIVRTVRRECEKMEVEFLDSGLPFLFSFLGRRAKRRVRANPSEGYLRNTSRHSLGTLCIHPVGHSVSPRTGRVQLYSESTSTRYQ